MAQTRFWAETHGFKYDTQNRTLLTPGMPLPLTVDATKTETFKNPVSWPVRGAHYTGLYMAERAGQHGS